MKHAGGRPTKYNDKMPDRVLEYIDSCEDDKTGFPSIEGLSIYLDINQDTIVEWEKDPKKELFSASIKKLKSKQSEKLQYLGLLQQWNTAMSIFLLKNNHGFKDKTESDTTVHIKPEPILGGTAN